MPRYILTSIATTALLSASFIAKADTITIKADAWCPFNCEPDEKLPGFMVEIAKEGLEAAGHKVEYSTLNWARAIIETRQGNFTAIIGAAKTDAEDFIFPEEAQGASRNCFWTKPDSKWEFKDLKTIPAGAIGVIKDYSYDKDFDDYIAANARDSKKVDIVSGDNPLDLNLKKLQAGRIAAFVEDVSVMKNFMFQKKDDKIVKQAGCIEPRSAEDSNLYIAFSPKNPKAKEYAKIVSDHIIKMRKDGSLKKLMAKYGLDDWK